MHTPVDRLLKPSRVVALAIIAVLTLSLVQYRIAPEPWTVSVPRGADAGDLSLEPCTHPTEDGDLAADCGTLVVAENRDDPASRMIALPLKRIRAGSQPSREPLFRLEGGPGGTNMEFEWANRFAAERDVVLVGYRGVDGSSRLDCPEVQVALRHAGDLLGERSQKAYADAFSDCARRLDGGGVDLAGYTLSQRADDLEAARVALGYGPVDLVSESAGTRLALIYAWRHPGSVHRSVMIGANPPGHYLWDGRTTDAQLRHYATLCEQDAGCRSRTADLADAIAATVADMPQRWWLLPIEAGTVRVGSFYGLHESSWEAAPLTAPLTLDAWLSAADGDAGGLWAMSLMGGLMLPEMPVWGDIGAATQVDVAAADEHFAFGGKRGEILGNPGTDFIWAGGRAQHAWPVNSGDDQYRHMRTSDVETLVIGGTLDFTTPPEVATRELLPYLPNGHQVVLAELGHTIDFWTYQPAASSRLVNTFLDTGAVDESLYTPRTMDFDTPLSFADIARIAAGSMLLLALIAVASLVWMPLRVRRRGGIGPKAAAYLRSVHAGLVGLGAWSLLVLVGTAVWPTIPFVGEPLVVVVVGVAAGLIVYWAWVRRDRPATVKVAGVVAAMAGAMAGAWFGYPAAPLPLGILTAILGAVLVSNVGVIAVDIFEEWRPSPSDSDPVTVGAPDPVGRGDAERVETPVHVPT
ncbi:MAG: alpha/beta fold hydrolase [Acidimicrobiia bacterium]|nr:alpha/beta fold hydrolase [Acidimicrobiia bacterium]